MAGFFIMTKKFLHVGCGQKTKDKTTRLFAQDSWREVRLDINPDVKPDVIGTIVDLGGVESGSFDSLYSSHNIEHVYWHEVPGVVKNFYRVLSEDGYCVVTCPDLRSVASEIVSKGITEELYVSPAGPITPIDILYGHSDSIKGGEVFMAHRCGFTKESLRKVFLDGGFKKTAVMDRPRPYFDLWLIASKARIDDDEMSEIARAHFPV